jgi:glycosyltransferase involved in cell wall biosynthesis
MLLSIDVTPTLLDQFSHWYKRGGRALPHIGRRLKTAMLDRRIYHDARCIMAWSSLTRKSLIEEYGVPPDRVVVVPPGVDVNYWRGEPSFSASRQPVVDGARILFVGGDFERKGGDMVLFLARQREFKDCEFLCVTKADIPSPPANVKLFSAIAPNSRELVELYRSADIFFMPTRADFSPNALCEAMAVGLPVVSSAIGAIPEIVQHGKTGFLHEPEDREGFAGSLLTLLRDPQGRARMGSAGQRLAEDQFNLDKTAAAVLYYMATAAAR